ncbi:MAG: patatin-like phospholipase family protein [Gammaproteobacteria bacterium]|nr:patatin-like phospholipase family protein [Gammaproteobacteria bacterium]
MSDPDSTYSPPKTGLILSGGGARAAYQVGALKAIIRILPQDTANPFPIVCGTSAGAINATALAIYATRFHEGVLQLLRVWKSMHVENIFRSDAIGITTNSLHWLAALCSGGLGRFGPHAMLERGPLYRLLKSYLRCQEIQKSINAGALHALSITASGYNSGQSVTFYQGDASIKPWRRAQRIGCPCSITVDHLMASSAIPFIFSAVKINREYFGDGSMRQLAPLSSALHLGADRILSIGVNCWEEDQTPRQQNMSYPSMAQMGGHVLNSIFLDSMEVDIERIRRINRTINLIHSDQLEEADVGLRKVDVMVINPSKEIDAIAAEYAHLLPRPVRYLLQGTGALNPNGSNLLSYLLFEERYCRDLIAMGYRDTMQRRDEVLQFLSPD